MSNTLLLLLFGLQLQTSLISFVHGSTPHTITSSSSSSSSSSLIKSSCATTFYPEICLTTLSTTQNLATQNDVIEHTINKTKEIVHANVNIITNLTATATLTSRARIALQDCLQLGDGILARLDTVLRDLIEYPTKKSLRRHADDLKTLLSTAITNKETCLDGFSHDAPCKRLRKSIINGQDHCGKMCSNVLAMIKNMTDTDMANVELKKQELNVGKKKVAMWPEWLSRGDRKLLRSGTVTPNVTVAADGSGDFRTVGEAVAAAPSGSKSRYVIKIKAGVYKENVDIPSSKGSLMFIGDGRSNTVITGKESVAGGNTTYRSATVAVVGDNFLARDITFENTAGPSGHQAVALRVQSDFSAFYRCGISAYQDTLYVHSNRQFYVNCHVVGTVDFIFGNAAVVFQDCDIEPRRPNPNQKNMVTAQGRTDPNENTGIVIQRCRINATSDLRPVQGSFPTYLGRPWKEYSRTIVMESVISDVINPAGWYPWDGDFALDTLYYREYKNTGPGADSSKRVTWGGWGVIKNSTVAESFTPGVFIDGDRWLESTGFPFSLGL